MTTLKQIMNLVDAYGSERCSGNEYDNRYTEKRARDAVVSALKEYAPQRKPLTEQQIVDLCDGTLTTWEQVRIARAIEAAHGIKE